MFKLVVFALILALARANLQAQWFAYKKNFNKTYNKDEDILRHFIYQGNMMRIQKHNDLFYAKGLSSFSMGENQFTDWTTKEVTRQMNGHKRQGKIEKGGRDFAHVHGIPSSVDWRDKGYVTPVQDQGKCGACWAFAAVGAVEGQHFAKTKNLTKLSESNLVDCVKYGCGGGYATRAYNYIKDNGGIDTEKSYPYLPLTRECMFNKSAVGATVTGFVRVQYADEKALQKAVATIGPIGVVIDASLHSFFHYKKGVYDDSYCDKYERDHEVLVVGYGTEGGKDYWLVKNSWGTHWGENGYIKMSRNKDNQCGIASEASYPTV